MRRLNLTLALAAAALLALGGFAAAKDRGGNDHGHHGRHHHHRHDFPLREAGTIASFDAATGRLTIALTGGESVTGLVTDATEIKCEGIDDRLRRRDHGGDNSGPGSGQNEPGDDNGGRGEPEPGDDNGGQNEPGDDNGGEVQPAEASCSTASLTAGEIVGSAELRLEEGTAVFEEIELGFHS
jgi:hypothetical protein